MALLKGTNVVAEPGWDLVDRAPIRAAPELSLSAGLVTRSRTNERPEHCQGRRPDRWSSTWISPFLS